MNNDDLRKVCESFHAVYDEQKLIAILEDLRKIDPQRFMAGVLNAGESLGSEKGRAFVERWNFSGTEWAWLILEGLKSGRLPWEILTQYYPHLQEDQIGLIRKAIVEFRPAGKDLFLHSLSVLRDENPKKKPAEIKRDVNRWMDSYFAKPIKPYSEEQVRRCASWIVETQARLAGEKKVQSWSRTNIPAKIWEGYFIQEFGHIPDFADSFRKAARFQKTKIKDASRGKNG